MIGGDSGAIRAGRAFVEISANDGPLAAGLARAGERLRGWAATTSKIGMGLIGAGTSLIAPLLLAGKNAAAYGDGLNDASTRTGIAVDKLAELSYAADMSGSSLDSLEGGIKKMQVTLAGAAKGSGQAVAALAAVGLTAADLAGLSPDEQLAKIADGLAAIRDPAMRTAAAVKIFGKSGTDLLPMLAGGAAGLREMQARADALGLTLAATLAASVGDVDDLIGGLMAQVGAFATVVGVAVDETLRPIITYVQPILADWIRWAAANRGLVSTLLIVGAAVVVVGAGLLAAGLTATLFITAIGGIVSVVTTMGGVLLSVLRAPLMLFSLLRGAAAALGGSLAAAFAAVASPVGIFTIAVLAAAGAFVYLSGIGGEVLGYLGESWTGLKSTAVGAWAGIVAAVGAGDLALAGQIALAGLQLAWSEVVTFLKLSWASFGAAFVSTAADAANGGRAAFEIASAGIAAGWAATVKSLGDIWDGFAGIVRDTWNWIKDAFEDGLIIVSSKTPEDQQRRQAQANAARQVRDTAAAQSDIASAGGRQTAYDKEAAARASAHEAAMAKIGQESIDDNKAIRAAGDAEAERLRGELAAKRAEFESLVARAKAKPVNGDDAPGAPKPPKYDPGELLAAREKFQNPSGTFDKFGQSLNSTPLAKLEAYAQRAALAAERTADGVEKLEPGLDVE